MKKIVMLIMALAIFTGTNCFAAYCNDRGCKDGIKRIYTHSNGRVYIQFKNVNPAQANCTPEEKIFFVLYADSNLFSEINSQLQTSAMMGKEVWVRIVEGTNPCEVNYVQTWY